MAEQHKIKHRSAKRLVDQTVKYYLESEDFNGLPLSDIFGAQIENVEEAKQFLKPLIEAERITVRCDGVDLNPFIKRMPDLAPEREVARLNEWQGGILIAYPTRKEMATRVQPKDFAGKPFDLELALGAAWLEFRAFDLIVLEQYRNDPRYHYQVSDTQGSIWVRHEHDMKESDKVFLEHFGFAYDDKMQRAVAVFLSDLRKLSPEHQCIWELRRLNGDFKLHPIFWKTQVEGIWVTDSVVTDATLWEMNRINEYCEMMGKPVLFRQSFWQTERPRNFCFLIRPTAKEFSEFCQTLDKMMSENINREFFRGEITEEYETVRKDGKIVISKKGTISLLKEWLLKNWRPNDPRAFEDGFSIFKQIRDLRNPQAHKLTDDAFDQKYLAEQRSLLTRVYEMMHALRFILGSHPKVRSQVKGDDDLEKGEIFVY